MNLTQVVKELQKESTRLQSELSRLDGAITALQGSPSNNHRPHRGMSAAGRRRIADAQRLRWAKIKAKQKK